MTAWKSDELRKIGAAEELEIALVRRDGALQNPVTIWVIRRGDDLYVRSVNGRTSSWFRTAKDRHEAHIEAGGVDQEDVLVETEEDRDELSAADRRKNHGYGAGLHV